MKLILRTILVFSFIPVSYSLFAQSDSGVSSESSRKLEDHPYLGRSIQGNTDPHLIADMYVFNIFSKFFISISENDPDMLDIQIEYLLGLENVDSSEFIDALKQYLSFAPRYIEEQKRAICSDTQFTTSANLKDAIDRFNDLDKSTEILAKDNFFSTIGQVIGVENLQKVINWSSDTFRPGMGVVQIDTVQELKDQNVTGFEYLNKHCSESKGH